MYPVSLGFEEAERRMAALTRNGHDAEALITSVFTFEKTLRRALRYCAVQRGFTSRQSKVLFDRLGFDKLKELWPVFAPGGQALAAYVGGAHWQHVPAAVTMRNKLVHGERVYPLPECRERTGQVLAALRVFQRRLVEDIGFDGWSRLPVRIKPALPWLGPRA
jgi:hypothetical protein